MVDVRAVESVRRPSPNDQAGSAVLGSDQANAWRVLVAWCKRNAPAVGTVTVDLKLILAVDAALHGRAGVPETSPGPSRVQSCCKPSREQHGMGCDIVRDQGNSCPGWPGDHRQSERRPTWPV